VRIPRTKRRRGDGRSETTVISYRRFVLRLQNLKRTNGAYYLNTTLAGGADPSGLVETDGRWQGSLAELLGVGDVIVDPRGLAAALRGADPRSRRPLDAAHHRVKVAAIDCVFAAPKSVSVLHALGSDEAAAAVRAAHENAVCDVLGYLERQAAYVRRRERQVPSNGLLAAAFVHRTSRAPDPHLHTHLLVVNLGTENGERWSAIDTRPIYAHVAAAGSLYRAGLRGEISDRLDVSWERRVEGFADIIGISKIALRGFSQRSDEIDAELREAHDPTRRQKDLAAHRTRQAKQLALPYGRLVERWRERAFELGISPATLERFTARPPEDLERELHAEKNLTAAIDSTVNGFDRPFSRRELVRGASARVVDGASVDSVERSIDERLRAQLVPAGHQVEFLDRSSGRFPAGLAEQRFMTNEVADLVRDRDNALDRFGRATSFGEAAEARASGRGAVVVAPSVASYDYIRQTARRALADGRRVLTLAASELAAVHLEAVTGICPERWGSARRVPADALVVVDNPRRTPLRETVELFSSIRTGRVGAIVLDPNGPPVPAGDVPSAGSDWTERFRIDGVRVHVSRDLPGLGAEVRRLSERARGAGRVPVVVCARPQAVTDLEGAPIGPERLARAIEVTPRPEVIVIGSARVLGRGLGHVPDERRVHLLVAPLERVPFDRSFVLGIAEPLELRSGIGRYPLGSADRVRWGRRVEARERTRVFEARQARDLRLAERHVRALARGRDPGARSL
jgi:conjugative relaxase-like TrwC/TraI family protein